MHHSSPRSLASVWGLAKLTAHLPTPTHQSCALTHPMLSSSQLLEWLLSRRKLQGGEPGGVAGGLRGCSQLAG